MVSRVHNTILIIRVAWEEIVLLRITSLETMLETLL